MQINDGWPAELLNKLQTKLLSLTSVWATIGCDDALLQQNFIETEGRIMSPLDSMISDANHLKSNLSNEIEHLKVEISRIETELGIPPTPISSSKPLIPLKAELTHYRVDLHKKIDELTAEFKKLKSIEEGFCSYLDEEPLGGFPLVPSAQDKSRVQNHINQLNQIQNEREFKLSSMRERILSCVKYLGSDNTIKLVEPVYSAVHLQSKPTCLTTKFLREVDDAQDAVLDLFHQYKSKEEVLLEGIESLRNRLGMSPYSIPEDNSSVPSLRLEYGGKELARLRELRLANLRRLTEACALELEGVWSDCSIATGYRQEFRDSIEPDSSEEMLIRLESEVQKWRHFKQTHQDFYDALTVWLDTLQQIKAIEMRRQDPIVLKNRGGILLKLDKEDRKLRTRDLPNQTSHLEGIIARECSQGVVDDLFSLVCIEGQSLSDLQAVGMKENLLASVVEKTIEPQGGQNSVQSKQHSQTTYVYASGSSTAKRPAPATARKASPTRPPLQQKGGAAAPLSELKKPRLDYRK